MEVDDFPGHAEAQAGTFAGGFGGEERVEHLADDFGWDAGAIIGDFHDDDAVTGAKWIGGTGAEVASILFSEFSRPGGDRDDAAFFHGLNGIDEQVDDDLFDACFVGPDGWQGAVEAFFEADVFAGELVAGQQGGAIDDLVELDRLPVELAVAGEIDHAHDDFFGAGDGFAHFFQDDGHVFVLGGDISLEVFDAHEEEGEGVFDLMSDPGGEASDGF